MASECPSSIAEPGVDSCPRDTEGAVVRAGPDQRFGGSVAVQAAGELARSGACCTHSHDGGTPRVRALWQHVGDVALVFVDRDFPERRKRVEHEHEVDAHETGITDLAHGTPRK